MRRNPLTAVFVLFARTYIDPGTGFIIVTSVLGVMTSIGYFFRTNFNRLKRLFSSGGTGDGDSGTVAQADQPDADSGDAAS